MQKANYIAIGKIHFIGDLQEIDTGKKEPLLKRTLVLEVPVKKGSWDRTNFLAMETWNKGTYQLDQYEIGDNVEVEFTVKSTASKNDPTKWWTNTALWGIQRIFVEEETIQEDSPLKETHTSSKLNDEDNEFEDLFNDGYEKTDVKQEAGKFDDFLPKKDLFDTDEWPEKSPYVKEEEDFTDLPF